VTPAWSEPIATRIATRLTAKRFTDRFFSDDTLAQNLRFQAGAIDDR
jgi:hypothetical protein